MSYQSEYQVIFTYLRSLNFHFSDTWVKECVNYYKSTNPDISLEVLKNEVKQQWLLVNLREIKVPSLPPDLKTKEKFILNGKYAVQVETMIDSSESCYSQFRKLRMISDENIEATTKPKEWDFKSKRCLTFGVSDGLQEIHAMEYRPILKIRTNDPELLPGFKMIIMGPVECRKGMILLKDENVRVCGGEVDVLTQSNSLKSILIRRLDLNEDEFQGELTSSDENIQVGNTGGNVASLLSEDEDMFLSLPLEAEILAQEPQARETENQNSESQSSSRKHTLSAEDAEAPSSKKLSLDKTVENSTNEFNDILIDNYNSEIEMVPKPKSSTPRRNKPVQTKVSSFFKSSEFSAKRTTSLASESVSGTPFVYLKQIVSINLTKPTDFTIKALIFTLKKKITIENNEFNLSANITDGSLCIEVDFSSDILEGFLGYSPCEMASMIKFKQTNSAISQRIKESFSKAQEKLISLNCLMNVRFFPNGKPPVVLLLKEVTTLHLEELKKRNLSSPLL